MRSVLGAISSLPFYGVPSSPGSGTVCTLHSLSTHSRHTLLTLSTHSPHTPHTHSPHSPHTLLTPFTHSRHTLLTLSTHSPHTIFSLSVFDRITASQRQRQVLLWDGLTISVREPGPSPRANGAYLVVDHFLRGKRIMKKKKKVPL